MSVGDLKLGLAGSKAWAPLNEVGSEAELCVHSALGAQGLGTVCSSPPGPIGGQYGEADGRELNERGSECCQLCPRLCRGLPSAAL